MAKDDYFVIVYRLLTYLYDCLKCGLPINADMLNASYFSINDRYWEYIIRNMDADEYMTGILKFAYPGNPVVAVKISPDMQITPKGIQYLSENSMFQKIKDAAKDIAAVIPV